MGYIIICNTSTKVQLQEKRVKILSRRDSSNNEFI